MSRGSFRIVPHTAEISVEAEGQDLEGFLEAAASGLLAVYATPAAGKKETKRLRVAGADEEELLISFLNELIYLVATKHWMPEEVRVRLEADKADATLEGWALGERRPKLEIKAATFGALRIEKGRGERRKAVVILDV